MTKKSKKENASKVKPSLFNGAHVAELVGVSERRLRQLAKEGWFPSPVRGVWEEEKVISGAFSYYQKRDGTQRFQELKREKLEVSIRVDKSQAETAQMDLDERKRDLNRRSEIAGAVRDCLAPVRKRLLALPTEAASKANPSDPAYAQKALQEWTDQVLATIRDPFSKQ